MATFSVLGNLRSSFAAPSITIIKTDLLFTCWGSNNSFESCKWVKPVDEWYFPLVIPIKVSLESKIGIFVTAEHYAFSIGIMNKAKFFLEYVTSPFFKMLQTVYTDGIKLYQLYRSPTTKLWSGNQIMYSRWISIGTWKVAVSRLSATRALSSIDMNVIGSGPNKIQASIMSSINDFPIILSLFFYLRLLSERNSLTGTISHFLGKNHKYKVDRFILNPIF